VNPEFHDEFVALCALYHSGDISEEEWALLQIHMAYCDSCHEKFLQYQQITSNVIPAMAAVAASDIDRAPKESAKALDASEKRLMSRLDSLPADQQNSGKRKLRGVVPFTLLAACLIGSVCLAGIYLTRSKTNSSAQAIAPATVGPPPQQAAVNAPRTDAQEASKEAQEKIASLQQQLAVSTNRLSQSGVTATSIQKQLEAEQAARKEAEQERETIGEQLAEARAEATSLQNKLDSAGADTNEQSARVQTLEARVRELKTVLDEKDLTISEKDRMLALDKDFLAHDRDIRDLIGARNLYIADISDTTENGKAARQFGRIFYTKDRSLVFYGFDLDSQAERKQDVSFQVWGSGSDKTNPVSLGLFYQDDTHKRWILRCNDAKTLARLDMVFVTVEPTGGSAKPTGKQLLRAYLQIQPNHP
jgi:hypothetical protein